MNLYLISQDENSNYDTFDSAVVAAPDEEAARRINPDGNGRWDYEYSAWCKSPDVVKVELIGVAVEGTEQGMILASFNAG